MTRDEDGAPAGRPLPPRLDPRAGRPAHPHGASSAPQRAASRTRRGAVVAHAVAAVLSVVLLGTSGWGWYLTRVAEATVTRTDAIPDSGNADAGGAAEAMDLLLVGNDSRADLTPEQLEEFSAGTDSGTNTDTMILVHVPADGSRASFVSFPRDSYVEIPGHGTDKLNAAYALGYGEVDDSAPEDERRAGGRQLLVQTISRLTGLMIDHYAEVDLLGFFELSSVVGGVEVNLCSAVDDSAYSGAVFDAGVQVIEGAEALAFVRQRHGVRPDGSPALPRGDLDRIVRQQVFIGGVLRKILSQDTLLDLGTQRRLVEAASRSLTIDEDLDLLDLAQRMQAVRLDGIQFQTVPIADPDDVDDDGRSIVRLADAATLRAFFAELSAEPEGTGSPAPEAQATVAPSEVSVEVYNGSGIAGLAADATAELEAVGFVVTSTGNAATSDHTHTVVRHAAGDEALAATLAAAVPGAVTEVSDDPDPGTVQLVLGSDAAGSGGAETPAEPAAPTEEPRTAEDTSCIN
ncbi:transcriptional attenuator, LytR family [Geodermatophilus dictyosporus]|uniref:Transcriptional attenuator, LytR family n=1 Tax=Geodermatophilus dictyosporus TaxID=1523247 RepID=A0A1I5PAF3_9ACTN|nr:LCP family protein [Geodermatophilus dictyosporus]SFP30770.1 transcriptional attenuator, LytR family [Geodermatophilus dictyosporus]